MMLVIIWAYVLLTMSHASSPHGPLQCFFSFSEGPRLRCPSLAPRQPMEGPIDRHSLKCAATVERAYGQHTVLGLE